MNRSNYFKDEMTNELKLKKYGFEENLKDGIFINRNNNLYDVATIILNQISKNENIPLNTFNIEELLIVENTTVSIQFDDSLFVDPNDSERFIDALSKQNFFTGVK